MHMEYNNVKSELENLLNVIAAVPKAFLSKTMINVLPGLSVYRSWKL